MFEEQFGHIRTRIVEACRRHGRDPGGVTLVAVTKTFGPDAIRAAMQNGVTDIGESRIQEAAEKFELLGDEIAGLRRHLIGHLQTNKVKKAVELFDVIQSLDRWPLAEEIQKQASRLGKVQDCLIEIKVSTEETKHGLDPDALPAFVHQLASCGNIRVLGVMAMAPYFDDPELARPYFARARAAFETLRHLPGFEAVSVLSMGMSGDLEPAIAEGATMVRVGTALYGGRTQQ